MMALLKTKSYTIAEYLELDVAATERSEYRNGEIVSITSGTPNHNDIAGNLYILLKTALKGQNYRTFYADQRLWVPEARLYTYPDIAVVPNPLELQSGRTDTIMNPCLIAEVLSKSTQNYDRGEKFLAYRTIPSLREYLLIDQYRIHVEHYLQTAAHQWLFSEYDNPTTNLTLETLDIEIQIADIYETIDFTHD